MKLIGRLPSSAIADISAFLQYRALQRQQIQELLWSRNYDSLIVLSKEMKKGLETGGQWSAQELHINILELKATGNW